MSILRKVSWHREYLLLMISAFLLGTGLDVLLYQTPLRPLGAEVRFFAVFFPVALFVLVPFLAYALLQHTKGRLQLPASLLSGIALIFAGLTLVLPLTKDVLLHANTLIFWIIWLLLLLFLSLSKARRTAFAQGIIFAGLTTSVLAILQVLADGSLGLTMLGEAQFSADIVGSSRHVWGDFVMQRGYGLFPHPNIAFAWIATAFFAMLASWSSPDIRYRPTQLLALLILLTGMLATGSKSIGILIIALALGFLWMHKPKNWQFSSRMRMLIAALLIILPITGVYILLRSADTITDRLFFLQEAWMIFIQHPFGVGLGMMPATLATSGVNAPWMLQPVHNIFALMFVEAGVLAGLGWILLHTSLAALAAKETGSQAWVYLSMVLFLIGTGLFDHYWMTYPPLFLLTAYIGALVLSKHLARRTARAYNTKG